MISGQKALAVVAARGGSKGIPGKNLRRAGGKPLMAWAIEADKDSRYVSSEGPDIIRTSRQWGCEVPYVRQPELARDDSSMISPVSRALEHFRDCLELYVHQASQSRASVSEDEQYLGWMYTRKEDNRTGPLISKTTLSRHYLSPVIGDEVIRNRAGTGGFINAVETWQNTRR